MTTTTAQTTTAANAAPVRILGANNPLNKKAVAKDLKPGDKLSEQTYYEVVSVDSTSQDVILMNEQGSTIRTQKGLIEEAMYSATQFNDEIIVTPSEAADLLANIGSEVFSASFNKKADKDSIQVAIDQLEQQNKLTTSNGGQIVELSNSDLVKLVQRASEGAERVITARIHSREPKLGRTSVIDMDVAKKAGLKAAVRLIDHRTINWIVYKGVKYTVK